MTLNFMLNIHGQYATDYQQQPELHRNAIKIIVIRVTGANAY